MIERLLEADITLEDIPALMEVFSKEEITMFIEAKKQKYARSDDT